MILPRFHRFLPLLALGTLLTSGSFAGQVSVDANMTIYGADQTTDTINDIGGGTAPASVSVAGDSSLTLSVSGGPITLNAYTYNDADGIGSVGTSYTVGINGLSSIGLSNDGALVGVFIDTNTYTAPGGYNTSATAPAALIYGPAGSYDMGQATNITTDATSYTPLLNQVFFIGDGLTGDGTGTAQTFYVPTGATELYLGIADAGNYNGSPGSYGDNYNGQGGPFVVSLDLSSPSQGVPDAWNTAALLLLSSLALFGLARGKAAKSAA